MPDLALLKFSQPVLEPWQAALALAAVLLPNELALWAWAAAEANIIRQAADAATSQLALGNTIVSCIFVLLAVILTRRRRVLGLNVNLASRDFRPTAIATWQACMTTVVANR